MSRRWSDAQYTGRYLRRTIVHGKGERRPKRKKTTASHGEAEPSARILAMFIIIPIGLIILYFVSKFLFCVALFIIILYFSVMK